MADKNIGFLHNFVHMAVDKCRCQKVYYLEKLQILTVRGSQKKALNRLQNKETIKCVFFALFPSIWKYDKVFKLMKSNPRFEPIILACPIVNYGHKEMVERINACVEFYKQKGYPVFKAYDEISDRYLDVRKEMAPDIIFYTNPYQGLIDDRYYITNFKDILTVYVPYFINSSIDNQFSCDLLLHNLVWRKYLEYDYELELSREIQRVHGRNVVVTGYPGIEDLIDNSMSVDDEIWKIKDRKLKRIIWAPHHTLEASIYGHTCFLEYAYPMLELAKKYEDKAQFVFKPHPLLKSKLHNLWGEEKTESYYNLWRTLPNTDINEGEYVGLFRGSDAMIHDSGSFLVEYLYTNKPVLRTVNDVPFEKQFNKFGLNCLDNYYKAGNIKDIELFIQNVINDVDPLKEQRTKFVNEVLMPKGSPSQNIIDDILDSIDNQILYRN